MYLLHCLAGPREDKQRVFANLKPYLANEGVRHNPDVGQQLSLQMRNKKSSGPFLQNSESHIVWVRIGLSSKKAEMKLD